MEVAEILMKAERAGWPALQGKRTLPAGEVSWRMMLNASTPEIRADAASALRHREEQLEAEAVERAHQREAAEDAEDDRLREADRLRREDPVALAKRTNELLETVVSLLQAQARRP